MKGMPSFSDTASPETARPPANDQVSPLAHRQAADGNLVGQTLRGLAHARQDLKEITLLQKALHTLRNGLNVATHIEEIQAIGRNQLMEILGG